MEYQPLDIILDHAVTIGVIVFSAIVLAVVAALVNLRRNPQQVEATIRALLPDELERIVESAVHTATMFVERLDLEDELQDWLEDVVDKSEAKLVLAIELAAEQIEARVRAVTGRTIDIPEDTLIALVRNHVFENPDLFPRRRKDENPVE